MSDLTASPPELVRLSLTCLRAGQGVDDAWRRAEGPLEVPGGAAGDTEGGARLVQEVVVAAASASRAIGTLTQVLEIDADLLQRVAFDLTGADEQVAAALAAAGGASPAPGTV